MSEQNNEAKIQQLVDRANSDPAFRQELVANPQAAFAKLGMTAPEGLVVKAEPAAGGELSDDQLEAVAGGWGFYPDPRGGTTTLKIPVLGLSFSYPSRWIWR